ncbi:MAG: hypothetical protein ACRBN8_31830 [Nannocystales bacterium]
MQWGLAVALLGVVGLTACPSSGFFVCSTNSECDENGRCEPSGSCSFPDNECPTGRRYGELGNPAAAGQCVPSGDIGSTSTSPVGEGSGGGSTGASASSSTSGPTGGSSGASSGSSSTGSTSTGLGSSSGVDPILPDLWEPCQASGDCMGICLESVDVWQNPVGHACTQECPEPRAPCTDPETGAEARCAMQFVDGQNLSVCLLDCSETGTAGCPEGMVCALEELPLAPPRCVHPAGS